MDQTIVTSQLRIWVKRETKMRMARPHFLPLLAAISLIGSSQLFAAPILSKILRGWMSVPLHDGVNRVANFAGDGREALVTLGWRENGNAHGYSLYSIFMRPTASSTGVAGWNVVGLDEGSHFDDTIADAPHTGEDIVKAVRLLKVNLHKRRQTVLVIATRHWRDSIPEPATTTIEVFTLKRSQGEVGTTSDFFARFLTVQTISKYCNADMALKHEIGLALPPNYAGSTTATGC